MAPLLSSSLILTLTTTYFLITILLVVIVLRILSLRRARTTYSPLSLRGVGGILIWTACLLTLGYAILGTWWWVTAEEYMRKYLATLPPGSTSWRRPPPVMSLGRDDEEGVKALVPPEEIVRVAVAAEMCLTIMYVVAVWAVKGVFLCLIREGWGRLKGVARGLWWGAVGAVGVSFVGAVVAGSVVVGLAMNAGDVYQASIFINRHLVILVGVTHILTLLLVILTGLLSLRCLSPHFPPSISPRQTGILFVAAFLSIFFTIFRLFAATSPSPRLSFISILSMGELVMLASIACLPSTAIAKASSLHGTLTLLSNPPSPTGHVGAGGMGRNYKHLSVSTEKTRVTAQDFGYRVDQMPISSYPHMSQNDPDNPSHRIPSAPLFIDPVRKPDKVQLRPTWDEKAAMGVSDGSSEEESSSDEERSRWISGRRSARVSGLRSGYEEGREWRRGGGDEVGGGGGGGGWRTPGSARAYGRGRTPRTPRGFV